MLFGNGRGQALEACRGDSPRGNGSRGLPGVIPVILVLENQKPENVRGFRPGAHGSGGYKGHGPQQGQGQK